MVSIVNKYYADENHANHDVKRIFMIVKKTLRFYFQKRLHKILLQWLNNIIE